MLGEFVKRTVIVGGATRGYQVYVAPKLPKNPPAILFLHGYGETGEDNENQTKVGLGHAIMESPERWPFLAIFPQKPTFDLWPHHIELLNAILEAVEAEFKPSETHRFITGLSQGGNGTLTLVGQLKWNFAAAVACCGWADPMDAMNRLAHVPTWLIHGEKDPVVPPSSSRVIEDWLAKNNSVHKATYFPDADHNCWDLGYKEAVPEWFNEHAGSALK